MRSRAESGNSQTALLLDSGPSDHEEADAVSPISAARPPRRRPRRTIERLLRILGEFTLVLDDGWIRHFSNRDPHPRRRRLNRAVARHHLSEFLDRKSFRWIEAARQEARRNYRLFHAARNVMLADGRHEFVLSVMSVASHSSSGRTTYLMARDLTKWQTGRTELQKNQALLAQSEELANVGSWELDLRTNTLTWSAHFFKMLGLAPQDGPANDASRFIHPDDWARAQRDAEHARNTGDPFENELRFLTPDRGVRIFHSRAVGIRDASGRVVRIRGMSQDVTEQRQAEQALREREMLLAQAEQVAALGSYQCDYATQSLKFSANLHKIYAFEPDATWTVDDFWAMVHPDDRAHAQKLVEDAYREKTPVDYVVRLRRRDGVLRYLNLRDVPVANANGSTTRRVGIVQDITEQRQAEEKLREREALLAQAEEIANFGSYQYDCVEERATLSPNLRKLYGIEPDAKWSASQYWDHLFAPDRREAQVITTEATRNQQPFEYIARFRRDSGETRVHLVRGVPVFDEKGQVLKRIGVIQDVTNEVRQENEMRRLSQDLLRAKDEEQRRIARELHESAGQSLAALKMSLGRLRDALPEGDTPERALLRSCSELADSAVREVRTVTYLMHPPLLDEAGLIPALRWFARGFGDRSGIQVSVNISADLPRSSREIETTVFRIVQEALTNVHRYSGSRTAGVRVFRENGNLIAEVRDEGCGLPPPTRVAGAPTDRGVGIAGMRERVKHLNGIFELESTAGKGTTVRAILPVEPKEENRGVIRAQLVSSKPLEEHP